MKVKNSIMPTNKFDIENINNGKCDIVFYSDIQEVENQSTNEENTNQKNYEYNVYRITVSHRDNINEVIEAEYDKWLDFAKKQEYEILASEVRAKRNELLAQTDKEMCIDRLGIEIPENINATNLLTAVTSVFKGLGNILNNTMSKYRQELRDITKQEGFPYNIKWPSKEDQ